jgi:squalene synthase HpnC
MAKAGRENFPVASRFLPRPVRSHLLAIYGYARLVDDTGDEAPGDRLGLLDELAADLDRAYAGSPSPEHPVLRRLVPTIRAFDIPKQPLLDLIEANRQDQRVTAYDTFDALLGYCSLSANPVGRLVLSVFRSATPENVRWSDSICTGLQLLEHWQDVAEDHARGRVYLPTEDLDRFGVRPEELGGAGPASPAFRRLMAFEVDRARDLVRRGWPLVRALGGRAGLAVAAFAAGGLSGLDAIARGGYDVLLDSPRPSPGRRVWALTVVVARSGWRPWPSRPRPLGGP